MPTDSAAVLSGDPLPIFVSANVGDAELIEGELVQRNREAWDGFIDTDLVEWGRNPQEMEDEDFDPPNAEVVYLACRVAMSLRDEGIDPPTRVVPDGEGGISFERVEGEFSASLNIYADGTSELLTFDDCRLRGRRRLL